MAENSILIQVTGADNATINLVKSANVKVFPCAYRGYYQKAAGDDTATVKVFDPEARGFTEYNFSNTFGKLGKRKTSFIVDWQVSVDESATYKSVLKCVVGGYYFELYDIKPEDFINGNKLRYLAIRTKDVVLANETDDTERKTKILDSFVNSTNYLDINSNNIYVFTGLAILDEDSSVGITDNLFPFTKNANNEIVLNNAAYGIQETLDSGDGMYSIKRLGGLRPDSGAYFDGIATGSYSLALGKSATASGDSSTALGTETIAAGDNSVAFGNGTKALGKNSLAIGDGTIATRKNSLVLGQYNDYYKLPTDLEYDENSDKNVLIIGAGTSAANKKSVLEIDDAGNIRTRGTINATSLVQITNASGEVKENKLVLGDGISENFGRLWIYGNGAAIVFDADQEGNLKLANTLEVAGSTTLKKQLQVNGTITASGAQDNTLTLGSNASGEYGAINVYGDGSNKVFYVAKTGDVNMTGALTVGGNASVTGTLTINGATELKGNTTTQGDNTITGDLTVNKSLTVTKGIATTDSTEGTLSIAGTASLQKGLTVSGGNITATGSDIFAKQFIIKNGDKVTAQLSNTGDLKIKNTFKVDVTETTDTTPVDKTVFSVANTGNVIALGTVNAAAYNIGNDDEAVSISVNKLTKQTEIASSLLVKGALANYDSWELLSADSDQEDEDTERVYITKETAHLPELNVAGTADIREAMTLRSTLEVAGEATFNQKIEAVAGAKLSGEIEGDSWVVSNGEISALSFNATSDARKKTNIEDFNYDVSILDLPIKTFEFKGDFTHRKHIGCIAQDLMKLYPELVHEGDDGYLSIEEGKLVYLLLKEVKLLRKELNELKGE